MVSTLSSAGSPSPFQGGAGDVFLSIYSGARSSGGSGSADFDSSGIEAIVAAYSSSAAVVDISGSQAPPEESSLTEVVTAINKVQDRLSGIQDLAYASADPFATDNFRAALQRDVRTLVSEIQTLAKTTSYNGERLFDGTSFRVQVGGGRNVSIQAAGIDLESLAFSLSNLDVSTLEGAYKTYDAVEKFSDRMIQTASRSVDSAETRRASVSQGLDLLTGSSSSPSSPSLNGASGIQMSVLPAAQLIQSYQVGSASSLTPSLLSLFA